MYYIIFNPVAAKGRSKKALEIFRSKLNGHAVDYHIEYTQYPGHATELAAHAVLNGYRNIVAVGGDGTVLECACGLIHTETTLGIIPAGTGNDFIRALHIPDDPAAAADILFRSIPVSVDMGVSVDGHYFLNVSGTGFDVQVIKNTNRINRFLTGFAAYGTAVILAIFTYRFKRVYLTLDDAKKLERDVLLVAVANGTAFGGGMKVAPEASVRDGLFNLTVINKLPRWKIPFILPRFKNGRHEKIKCIEKFVCAKVEILTEEPQPIQSDGEVIGNTPVIFQIEKRCLNVFAPDSNTTHKRFRRMP